MNRLGSPLRLGYGLVLSSFLVLTLSNITAAQTPISVSNLNFGTVQIGSSAIQSVSVTNISKSNVTIPKAKTSGSGFSFVGPNLPVKLGPNQTLNLSVSFAPQASGTATGSLIVTYWATAHGHGYGATLSGSLSGTGAASTGFLSAPSSLGFGSVAVGSSQTQTLSLSNTGASSLTISSTTTSDSCYTIRGLTLPYNLAAGANANLSVTFTPDESGADGATLTVVSTASNSSVPVSLSGTGTVANGSVGVNPGSMSFGNVTVGTTQTKSGTVTASGGSVTVSSVSSSSSAFSVSGLTLPLTLPAGQSAPFTVTFAPTTSGSLSASLSFFTSSSGTATEAASGTGATIQHIVGLSWNPSTSTDVTGYNIYRATSPSGSYTKLNSSLDSAMSYNDNTAVSGQTYYYATTAVDSSGLESVHSNQVQVAVPFP